MGDRTWLNLKFFKKDLPEIQKALKGYCNTDGGFWDDESPLEDGVMMDVYLYDVNYGGQKITEEMTDAKLTFHGSHGTGGEYGPYTFACYKGDFAECEANHESLPVAEVQSNGTANIGDALDYWRVSKKISEEKEGLKMKTPVRVQANGGNQKEIIMK